MFGELRRSLQAIEMNEDFTEVHIVTIQRQNKLGSIYFAVADQIVPTSGGTHEPTAL